MKIICLIHMAVPLHNAGGETTIHAAMRAMVERGHDVQVICKPHDSEIKFDPYEYEGVKVIRPPQSNAQEWFRAYFTQQAPDLVVTHLDLTFEAMQVALDLGLPLVHFVHNSMQLKYHRVTPLRCQLAVFNSRWVAEREQWAGPQIVMHPAIEPERYRCARGTKITLVNPTPGKGADLFYKLSRELPECEFLVVKSVYGEQIAPPNINMAPYPNVECMEHTADIREVFRKTRIVLMPSAYESFGRVAVEAACAGIPAIVHPTEGLLEALEAKPPEWLIEFSRAKLQDERTPTPEGLKGGWISGAGIFCDRDDIESWKAQITRLNTDEVYYRSRMDAASAMVKKLNPEASYDRLEEALLLTVENWNNRSEVQKMVTWISDSWIWRLQDGNYRKVSDQRIPADAVMLFAGKGVEIPQELAIQNGWVEPETKTPEAEPEIKPEPEAKMIAEPEENKALKPGENKTRKRKAKVA